MPYDVVRKFEQRIAEYAGSRYAVSVESGTAGIFLACVYCKVNEVTIPKFTYPSVPCSIIHAGGKVKFHNRKWKGVYDLAPYGIVDGALRFKRGMYEGGYYVLSFHAGKHIPIGRGGMILTDSHQAYEWFKRARFDGRHECPLNEDTFDMLGFNMYMTPEQASRGLQLFELYKNRDLKDLDSTKQNYPDLSKCAIYGHKS